MLTTEVRSRLKQACYIFWTGGVSDPLAVVEQITYLLCIKRLDELQTLEENESELLGIPIQRCVFPEGSDERGRPYADMRWSRFKTFEPCEMMTVVADHVFPFLRLLFKKGSRHGAQTKDAHLGLTSAILLAKAVSILDEIHMEHHSKEVSCTSTWSAGLDRQALGTTYFRDRIQTWLSS